MSRPQPHPSTRQGVRRQRGVVLLFSLIALVIMLIAAVALVRSFHSSLFTAGNIAFKRDLQNQSERAVVVALAAFRSGGTLDTPAERAVKQTASNYSAIMLPVGDQAIPAALGWPDDKFTASYSAPDLHSDDAGQSVKVRYVIDRLCAAEGDESDLGASSCMLASNAVPAGTSSSNLQSAERARLCPTCVAAAPQAVLYRLSIRVTGPRNTQSFFQSTFTVPSSM